MTNRVFGLAEAEYRPYLLDVITIVNIVSVKLRGGAE
jgi:hypothetical protein